MGEPHNQMSLDGQALTSATYEDRNAAAQRASMAKFCGCMGPAYGEPYCICEMERRGLPLNLQARAAAAAKSGPLLADLFGEGGIFHPKKREQQ